MGTEISLVNFHEQTLVAISHEGKQYVAMRNVVENLGLDWSAQAQRIKRHGIMNKGVVMITTPSGGGLQESLCLPLPMINGWLFGVDASRVKPELKERLIKYQEECFEVLNNHFTGKSTNPQLANSDHRDRLALLKFAEKLKLETNAEIRTMLANQISSLSLRLNLPAPDCSKIGSQAPDVTDQLAEFFDMLDYFESEGEAINHSRDTSLLAINMPQIEKLAKKHHQRFDKYTIFPLLKLSTSPAFINLKTVGSVLTSKTIKCWCFKIQEQK